MLPKDCIPRYQVTLPLAHAPLFIVSEKPETRNSELLQSLAHIYHDTEYS